MPPQDNPQDQTTNPNHQPSYGADPAATPEPSTGFPAPAEPDAPVTPDYSAPVAPSEPVSPYTPPAPTDFSAPVTPPAEVAPSDPVMPSVITPTNGSDTPPTVGPVVS